MSTAPHQQQLQVPDAPGALVDAPERRGQLAFLQEPLQLAAPGSGRGRRRDFQVGAYHAGQLRDRADAVQVQLAVREARLHPLLHQLQHVQPSRQTQHADRRLAAAEANSSQDCNSSQLNRRILLHSMSLKWL